MGGFKGVLVAKKGLYNSKNHVGCKVQVRPSMKKFEINTEIYNTLDLEVIRMATYSTGFLNKQVIGILWSNGVPEDVFLKMQNAYVETIYKQNDIFKMEVTEEYPAQLLSAIKFLTIKLRNVYKKGLNIYRDPLIGPLVKLVCYNRFTELRKRFRVYDEK